MRNGQRRSAQWIKRQMRSFTRDDAATECVMLLVDVRPPVTRNEIERWSDEQVLLAEDWAFAVHYSASDNNNRVPALPAHLKERRA